VRIVVCLAPPLADASLTALASHDAHAVEAALRIGERERAEGRTAELVVAAGAPVEALGTVRGALAMGVQRGALIDIEPGDEDLVGRASAVAAWVRDQSPDLVLCCPWSGDTAGTLFVAAMAEAAGMPVLTGARDLHLDARSARIERQTEGADERVVADLPCVVEVAETMNQARYPTVKGRARAQHLPIDLVRRGDPEPSRVAAGSPTSVTADRDTVVVDDPALAVDAIVSFLRGRDVA